MQVPEIDVQDASEDGSLDPGVEEDLEESPYEAAQQRKVLIQPYDYAVRTLMEMIIEGDLGKV